MLALFIWYFTSLNCLWSCSFWNAYYSNIRPDELLSDFLIFSVMCLLYFVLFSGKPSQFYFQNDYWFSEMSAIKFLIFISVFSLFWTFLLIVQYFLFLSKAIGLVLDFSPLLTLGCRSFFHFSLLFFSFCFFSVLLLWLYLVVCHLSICCLAYKNLLPLSPPLLFLWIYFFKTLLLFPYCFVERE